MAGTLSVVLIGRIASDRSPASCERERLSLLRILLFAIFFALPCVGARGDDTVPDDTVPSPLPLSVDDLDLVVKVPVSELRQEYTYSLRQLSCGRVTPPCLSAVVLSFRTQLPWHTTQCEFCQ